jgi:serine/threonine protein kinase
VEAAARLRHPRCLRALALERDDHHVYVAYEYVPGKTLRQCLRSGELDDAASVEIGAQVLDALAHAHGKKILHRDVKPGNVMVEDRDELSVRLLDFGLAQFEEAETLTAAGDVPGTLATAPSAPPAERRTVRQDGRSASPLGVAGRPAPVLVVPAARDRQGPGGRACPVAAP